MENSNLILEKLRAKGCRFTKARKAILDLILSGSGPFSARELSEKMANAQQSVNKATLYRELAFLKNEKIVRELQLADKVRRYEAMSDHRHCHAVCVRCHKVECVELGEGAAWDQEKMAGKKKFKVLDYSLEVFGLCGKCQ